jgi:K+-sensing histidine kinase KdpD
MPFGHEGKSLESHFAGIGSGDAVQLNEEPPWRRFLLTNALPLTTSLLLVGLVTSGLVLAGPFLPLNLAPVLYLIPVVIAATRWGTWPAIAAAIAGAAAADFFFTTPFYSFRMDDPQEIVDLLLFLFVALLSSNLASRLRLETETVRQREHEIQDLYEFSRRLAACFTVADLISAIQHYLSGTFGQHTAFFFATLDRNFEPEPVGAVPETVRRSAAAMMKKIGFDANTITDELTNNIWLLRAVSSEHATHGVIVVNIGRDANAGVDTRTRHVETVLAEASLTLQRLDIGGAMEEAVLRLKDQLLRDAFYGNLSHELRSPLAAIRGSASVLETMPAVRDEDQAHSLVDTVTYEAGRLDGFIGNLLNATRVSAGDIRPHIECADPRDVINAAIRQRARQLAAHHLKVSFADDLPMINVDSALVEEACGQILENAAKYSPSGSTISISTRAEQGRVVVSITDQGAGITPDEQSQLGLKSFRGERHQTTIPGAGLGFWIASTFIRANHGTIGILSRGQGQGTTVSIALPVAEIEDDEAAGSANE